MKKLYFLLLAAIFAVGANAQKMQVWSNNQVILEKSITTIDSITFIDESAVPDPLPWYLGIVKNFTPETISGTTYYYYDFNNHTEQENKDFILSNVHEFDYDVTSGSGVGFKMYGEENEKPSTAETRIVPNNEFGPANFDGPIQIIFVVPSVYFNSSVLSSKDFIKLQDEFGDITDVNPSSVVSASYKKTITLYDTTYFVYSYCSKPSDPTITNYGIGVGEFKYNFQNFAE